AVSENAQFPIANIKDKRTTKVSRSLTTVLTNEYVFDLKTASNVDSILLAPDSIRGFAALSGTVTIKANSIDGAWGAAPFTTTITIDADVQNFKFAFKTFPVENYRYWQISVENTQDYVELSKIFIGEAVTLADNNIDFGWTNESRDLSTFRRNRYGQRFTDSRNKQKFFRKLGFNLMTPEEMETIVDAFDEVGESEPLWCLIDDEATVVNQAERFAGYFYLAKIPTTENGNVDSFNLSFSLEEAT
ncbi:unnamed protein product, partial [marine sediment metagenome]